jgi:hypothetical protein
MHVRGILFSGLMVRFDLRDETPPGYRHLIVAFRWGLAVFDVLVAYFALAFFLQITNAGHPTTASASGLAFTLLWIAVSGWIVWALAPSASFVDIDDFRVSFEYPGGQLKEFAWTDPSFRLVIDRTPSANNWPFRGKPFQGVYGRRAGQDLLTPAAFQAILDGARRSGLRVNEQASARPGWTRLTINRANG